MRKCPKSDLVGFSCKGRGFFPSCLGRRMCATAANVVDHVLPPVPARQWVLTFPFAWRRRLGSDGELLPALTKRFVDTVLAFYAEKAGGDEGWRHHGRAAHVVGHNVSTGRANNRSPRRCTNDPRYNTTPQAKVGPNRPA